MCVNIIINIIQYLVFIEEKFMYFLTIEDTLYIYVLEFEIHFSSLRSEVLKFD